MFYLFGAGNDNNLGIFATNWNGIIDFMTLLFCIGLLLVYILVYPYILFLFV